jgi:methylenetetrahydrofolate dehydrogenase (NADP+) / methenyltetrahydrofolate cyclohydrolase
VSAVVLDGRALSRRLNQGSVKVRSAALDRPPGLAVILAGADPASQVYVRRKGVVAERMGFVHRQIDLPPDVTLDTLLAQVQALNEDPAIDGILVQLPLPGHLDAETVLDAVDPFKDVDGFHPDNAGRLVQGRARFVPCTPLGVMKLLEDAQVPLSGKQAVVLGRSDIVGKPMASLLLQAHCTVTICHSRTVDLESHIRAADVVVAAVGRPKMVRAEWIKPGAAVIDVGINRLDDGSLCGDVDPAAEATSGWFTPVPGGVGPMTIAMLMENTCRSAEARQV